MRINPGLVPFSQLFYLDTNAVEVGSHVFGAGFAAVCSLDLGTRALDDRIFVMSEIKGSKGATAGSVEQQIWKSGGTAQVLTLNDYASIHKRWWMQASESAYEFTAGWLRVVAAGTLTLDLALYSEGSNLTTLAGTGRLQVFIARGR